jgi:hypothetical protein
LWAAPKAGTKLATSTLKLSAQASFDQPTASVAKVTFTVSWGSRTKTACTAMRARKGAWSCTADLWDLGAPLSRLTLSFDVTDSAGQVTEAPAGTLAVSMTSKTTATVQVPVLGCPTRDASTFSDAYVKPRGLPSSTSLTLPLWVAGKVALYGTRASGGVERWLLGPRGWTCKAEYGVDGSGGIGLQKPRDASSQIDLGTSGANESSGWYMACAYFAAARKAAAAIGAACGTLKPPAAEVVTGRTAHVVLLADPARVKGSLSGSGGRYRTVGGIWYGNDVYNTRLESWAQTVACALPAGSSQICGAVVEDWQRRVGR